ncbi:hypothetical protein ACGFYV_30005 [Streptomyces sp. NPDC048297]|uniref:hypothetical protein n=1 Tax=Streptomyces sp. NPDC048297 TaxID=3365531 RepID=UPI00371D9E41
MWPGEQPPGGGQQHNPYLQPGHGGPGAYGQQPPAPWGQPPVQPPLQSPPQPPAPQPGGGRTKVVAVVAAAAAVVAACVTGILVLGGKNDEAGPGPTTSPTTTTPSPADSPTDNPRAADRAPKPTVDGWKVVANPVTGIAFDVPPQWQVRSKSWITYVTEDSDPDEKVLAGMKAPAVLKEKWCAMDEDKNGTTDYTSLANVGTRGNKGAGSTEEVAREDSANWVYGWFTQPDHDKVTTGPVTSYTSASGLTGSVATSRSSGVAKKHKCDSDGKATTFAFKDRDGAILSWSFVGAKGVSDEVQDSTVRAIMRTVRVYAEPADS